MERQLPWHRGTQALDASNIATGFYSLERKGAGIAPGVPKKGDAGVEGNTLAPFRRADIYIKGQADEHVAPSTQPELARKQDAPKAPDYSKQVHDFDRWNEYIANGNTDFIKGISLRVQAELGHGPSSELKTTLMTLGFKTTPPPWWSGRIPGSDQTGRRRRSPTIDQLAGKEKLIAKAQLLVRDYRELSFYATEQMVMIGKWRDAAIKSDAALVAKYAAPFEHLLFMIDETEKLAKEVEHLAE